MKRSRSETTRMFAPRMTPFLITWLGIFTHTGSPLLAASSEGWEDMELAGETRCADGSPYRLFFRRGTSGKLVIDFMGGGACWNAETCDPASRLFTPAVPDVINRWLPEAGGIYDKSRNDNPLKDDTHVMIPYCTGDIHWGNSDVNYGTPQSTQHTIYHRGAVNAKAAIDAALSAIEPNPSRILITGCSAGAYGSIWWTPYIAHQRPEANVIQFADSGAGIMTNAFREEGLPNWRIDRSAPAWVPGLDPAETDFSRISTADIYSAISKAYPRVTFSQFNFLNDIVQKYFYRMMGGSPLDWTTRMRAELGTLTTSTTNFSYFIGPWDSHCVIPSDSFYGLSQTDEKSILFPFWFNELLTDTIPPSETCDGCEEGLR